MKEKMTNKKACAIFGIILILIQTIAYFGMSGEFIGLYPDMEDVWDHSSSYVPPLDPSKITISKFLFGFTAGIDRFKISFSDLAYEKYDYRPMSAEQFTSALFRESFGCSDGGSIDLALYDTALTVSYFSVGILGLFFLLLASRMRN